MSTMTPEQTAPAPQIQQAQSEKDLSKNQKIKEVIRNMKNDNKIDFTNEKKYSVTLHQIAKDHQCDYTTAYKAFKQVARESGITKGKEPQNKTASSGGGINMNFKVDNKTPNIYQKQLDSESDKLKKQQEQLQAQMQIQQMQLSSPVFEFYVQQNMTWMLTLRQMIESFGGKVADEKRFLGVAQGLALKQMQGGFKVPSMLENAMLIVGIGAVFAMPLLPQIKDWALTDDKEKKTPKSETPLVEIPEPKEEPKMKIGEVEQEKGATP